MTAVMLLAGDVTSAATDEAADPSRRARRRSDLPPLSPRKELVRFVAVFLCILSTTLVLQLTVVGSVQERSSQRVAFAELRRELAFGTAPTAGIDEQGRLLPLGTPVALLEIPALDLREVVGEGTTGGVLMKGPGHERDTVLPGQFGASVIFGRRASFGGPFERIGSLKAGDEVKVTTGQGAFTYKVVRARRAGDPIPAVPSGSARLILVTADGSSYAPAGVLRVDADLVGSPVVGTRPPFTPATLPERERPLRTDTSTLWVLAFWLQALTVLAIAAIWAWHRWGHAQAWVVFLPPLLLVGLAVCGEAVRLLPNLL